MVVYEDPLVDVRGRGIESVPVGEPTEFTIDASNALFAANPVVTITGLQHTTTKLTTTTTTTTTTNSTIHLCYLFLDSTYFDFCSQIRQQD